MLQASKAPKHQTDLAKRDQLSVLLVRLAWKTADECCPQHKVWDALAQPCEQLECVVLAKETVRREPTKCSARRAESAAEEAAWEHDLKSGV